jgi:uncharacterized protein YaeQ
MITGEADDGETGHAMAVKATIHKAELEVVDMDRNYFATHRLTLACHPSETSERLMVRILAFALNAAERLEFGRGISDSDEPDLWIRDLAGAIELWVELGHPDEKVLARALGRSSRVIVYTYSANPDRWWDPLKRRFRDEKKLTVLNVGSRSAKELAVMAEPTMELQCSIQDGEVWFRDDKGNAVQVEITAPG